MHCRTAAVRLQYGCKSGCRRLCRREPASPADVTAAIQAHDAAAGVVNAGADVLQELHNPDAHVASWPPSLSPQSTLSLALPFINYY